MSNDKVVHATESNFDSTVIQSTVPVLVDFWAEWCGPCKAIAPVIDELATEFAGKVTFCKVNVDDNSALAGKYGIRGIPTLLLFKSGNVVDQIVGAAAKSTLSDFLTKSL